MIRRAIFIAILVCMAAIAVAANEKAKAPPSDQDDPIGRKLSERTGPYLQTVPFYFTKDEGRDAWKKKYEGLTLDEKVHYCIFQLRNESWYETDTFYRDEPYSKEPEPTASRELIKLGRAAIPQLLLVLDSRVSTKIHPSRHMREPWLVQDAALAAIENIACRYFGRSAGVFKLNGAGEGDRQEIRKNLADWWKKNKGSDEVQWAKDALLSETTARWESRGLAIDSLYYRLGKESYPFLVKTYPRLPKGRETADGFDETRSLKVQILQRLLKSPTANEKSAFASAVQDAPLWVRIDGAEGLWAIGDPSGLDMMVKEAQGKLSKDTGSTWLDSEYCNLVSFLVRCNTPSSREAVYKCLNGHNPYLRKSAMYEVPALRMEKAVRALPELFDDPFVLGGLYTEYCGNIARTVPPRRVCDEAAETFTKVVPDAPRFDGTTAETQQQSIDKMKRWWKENGSKLKWDEKRGMLVRPTKVKKAGVTVTLISDPVAAIRSALPKGWTILKVEENAYPPLRPKGKGKAIYFYPPQQKVGIMQDKASVVYIMPADYGDGGEDPTHGQTQKFPAALILTTLTAKVYLLGNETPFSATGWRTLKDDILKAISE